MKRGEVRTRRNNLSFCPTVFFLVLEQPVRNLRLDFRRHHLVHFRHPRILEASGLEDLAYLGPHFPRPRPRADLGFRASLGQDDGAFFLWAFWRCSGILDFELGRSVGC